MPGAVLNNLTGYNPYRQANVPRQSLPKPSTIPQGYNIPAGQYNSQGQTGAGQNQVPATYGQGQNRSTQEAAETGSNTGANWTVDANGNTQFSSGPDYRGTKDMMSYEDKMAREMQGFRENLGAEQEARHMGQLDQLWGKFGTSGTNGLPGRVSGGDTGGSSRDAIFARQKDREGQMMRGALDSLRGAYAGTGNVGGQSQGTARMMSQGLDRLGDLDREQAIQELARSQHVSDRDYAGNITQRAQDINAQQANLQAILGLISKSQLY